MRRRTTILILLALLGGGCGLFDDPWPSKKRVEESLPAGESVRDSVHLDDVVDDVDSYDVDVDGLPPGIHYEDDDLYYDDWNGDLILEYRIRVDEWVEPGTYRFHVHYRYWEFGLFWFRTEVVVRFTVRVLEPEPEEEIAPLELRLVQAVPAGQAEAAVQITSPR